MKIKGGLRQKNTNISSFQAVLNMIETPRAELTHVSYKSASGFIFKLDIPKDPAKSEFFGLNEDTHEFNVPIYSLIFKFSVISDDTYDILPSLIIGSTLYQKSCETLEDFKKESEVQQHIYLKTISPSGNPICLAVVDFSHFNPASTKIFLDKLTNIATTDTARNMVSYLYDNVNNQNQNHRQLGMITMELADGYDEIGNLYGKPEYDKNVSYAIAQLLICFTKLKIMNHDCHLANVLSKNNKKPFHIDFGRTIDFNDGKPKLEDAFPYRGREIIRKYNLISGNDYKTECEAVMEIGFTDLYVSGRTTEDVVMERMHRIIRFVAYVDYVTNITYYNMTGMERPQMNEFLKLIYGSVNMSDCWDSNVSGHKNPNFVLNGRSIPVYKHLIPLFEELTVADTMSSRNSKSANAIEKSIKKNRLFHINKKESYDRSSSISLPQPTIAAPIAAPSLRMTRKKSPKNESSKLKIGLTIVVIAFVIFKLWSGGSKSRKSPLNDQRKKIIKIITEKLKEYNCGIDFDLSNKQIKPISENEFNEYIKDHKIEIIDEPEDTCDLERLKIPPIEDLLKHVKKQLAVNDQIVSLRKTRRSLSKSSKSSKSSK